MSADYHIPLFHKAYEGNRVDSTSFLSLTGELVERYRALREHVEDITLVFDKGNNPDGGMEKVDESPYHFVGSLTPSYHKDLLEIPREPERYKPLASKGFPADQWNAYRTKKEVFGQIRTVVVTYNERLFVAQLKTIPAILPRPRASWTLSRNHWPGGTARRSPPGAGNQRWPGPRRRWRWRFPPST